MRGGTMIVALAALVVAMLVGQGMAVGTCDKSLQCVGELCCNKTVSDLFTVDMFEAMFNHRNDPSAHAQYFWTYESFIDAAKLFESKGFGSVGGDDMQKRELAAFLAHVAHETSCGWSGAKDGPYAWGLCYNQELAPDQMYCDPSQLVYKCVPGVGYYGRGALPIYWNYNYGATGVALKFDALNNPDLLSTNATLAFQAAIWSWMTPAKTRPSPHDVMIGKWVPTKNDTLLSRAPGFGMTINILAGDVECGHGDDPRMQDRISHYSYFLNGYFGVDDLGPNVDCGLQAAIPMAYAAVS